MRRDTAITPSMLSDPNLGAPAKLYADLREKARLAGQDAEEARLAVERAVEADRESGAKAILGGKAPSAGKAIETAKREHEAKIRTAEQLELATVKADELLLEAAEAHRPKWVARLDGEVEDRLSAARAAFDGYAEAHGALAGALAARNYARRFPDRRGPQAPAILTGVPGLRSPNGDPFGIGTVLAELAAQLDAVDAPSPKREPVPV